MSNSRYDELGFGRHTLVVDSRRVVCIVRFVLVVVVVEPTGLFLKVPLGDIGPAVLPDPPGREVGPIEQVFKRLDRIPPDIGL